MYHQDVLLVGKRASGLKRTRRPDRPVACDGFPRSGPAGWLETYLFDLVERRGALWWARPVASL